MSDLTTILVIIALAFGHIFIYWFVDRLIRDRLDMVATGIVRGVAVSMEHRRLSFWLSWFTAITGGSAAKVSLPCFGSRLQRTQAHRT